MPDRLNKKPNVIPAKAEVLFQQRQLVNPATLLPRLKSLDPRLRGDDDPDVTFVWATCSRQPCPSPLLDTWDCDRCIFHHNPFAASATARNKALPLFMVSSHSFSGSES